VVGHSHWSRRTLNTPGQEVFAVMTDLTAKFGIWKHSHGTKQTTGWEDREREQFMADSVLVIGDGLEQRQIDNFKKCGGATSFTFVMGMIFNCWAKWRLAS
jgi:hypothetical protein